MQIELLFRLENWNHYFLLFSPFLSLSPSLSRSFTSTKLGFSLRLFSFQNFPFVSFLHFLIFSTLMLSTRFTTKCSISFSNNNIHTFRFIHFYEPSFSYPYTHFSVQSVFFPILQFGENEKNRDVRWNKIQKAMESENLKQQKKA